MSRFENRHNLLVQLQRKFERLMMSFRYEDALPLCDQMLSLRLLPDKFPNKLKERLIIQKCECLGRIVMTNKDSCSQDYIGYFLTFSESVIERLHLKTCPFDENERIQHESGIRMDRMDLFCQLQRYDYAMNEMNRILQINPVSDHAYEAFCHRALIFGFRRELENMKSDIDSALQLRDFGFAVGKEMLVDQLTAGYESIMLVGLTPAGVDQTTVAQRTFAREYSERVARMRALSNDQIPYDPTSSNEWNFGLVFSFHPRIVFPESEVSDIIPVLCSHRKRIDACVHFAVNEKQKDQTLRRLSSTELSRNAILWASDAIKSPLLLFALRNPRLSLKEFDLNSLLRPQEDTSSLYPSEEGLIIAYHLIVDCEICSDSLVRWVIKNGTIVHCDRQQIVKDELMQCIRYFPSLFDRVGRLEIQNPRFYQQKDVCRYLFNVLLRGLDRFFVNQTHVTFVPDRELFQVPFGCLLDGNGRYLIDHFSFSVSNSLRLIGENAKQKERVVLCLCSFLVCGNARIDGVPSAALRVSPIVECVESLESSSPVVVVSHGQFTPMNLQKCCSLFRPQVVHLISHGSSHDCDRTSSDDILDQFQLSGTLSCSDGTELTARSVAETFDLHGTDLVFLNACELASGHTQALGVLGFNRAIFQAGCSSVISALWSVYAQFSNALSQAFYRCYYSGRYDKSESLQLAIQSLLQRPIRLGDVQLRSVRDFPVFWAPYQLFGNRV